jgi:hypothetical protein
MKSAPPDTCLEDYEKRRGAFLKNLIAFTSNVSVRAKEFRRWIDENSPYRDGETRKSSSRRKSFEKRPPINFERGTQTQRNVRGGQQQAAFRNLYSVKTR